MTEDSAVRSGVEVVPDDESGVHRCGWLSALSARGSIHLLHASNHFLGIAEM